MAGTPKPQIAQLSCPTRCASGWAYAKWNVLGRLWRRWVVLGSCMLEVFDSEGSRSPLLSVCVVGATISTVPGRREIQVRAGGQRIVLQWSTDREYRACVAAFNYANRDVNDFYKLLDHRVLGQGRASRVVFAFDITTGTHTAVKIVSKTATRPSDRIYAERECAMRSSVQHPAFVQTLDIFESPSHLYLVMEHMSGGSLQHRLSLRSAPLQEADARIVLGRTLCALRHLHAQGIVHRNVKPENVLLDNSDDTHWAKTAKLADLSLACRLDDPEAALSVVGTPDFLAPEASCMVMLPDGRRQVAFGTEIDLWAAGVMLYYLLSMRLPFDADTPSDVFRKVRSATFDFSPHAFAGTSHEVRSLIRALLNPQRRLRLTAAAALHHPWFTTAGPLQPTAAPRPAPRRNKCTKDPAVKALIGRFRVAVASLRALRRFQRVAKTPVEPPTVAQILEDETAAVLSRSRSTAAKLASLSSFVSAGSTGDLSPRRPRTRTPPVISRVSNSSTVHTRSSGSDEQLALKPPPSPTSAGSAPGWRTAKMEAFARAEGYRGNEIPFRSNDSARLVSTNSHPNVRVLQSPKEAQVDIQPRVVGSWSLREQWEQRSRQP